MTNLLDLPAVSGHYLFPQSRSFSDPWIVSVQGANLACYRSVVAPDEYTLVHFHGNGEAVADYHPWMAEQLARLGLNSLFIEYREYGESTGRAQLVAMLGDGEEVVNAAGLRPERLIAFGRSIGSLYAIELAHRLPKIAGLILESGIADPAQRFLKYADLESAGISADQVIAEAHQHFNHQQKLSEYHQPLLLLHTIHDGLVDISHAEQNFDWAASRIKNLIRFQVGDHNRIMDCNFSAYFSAIREFVDRIEASDR